MKIYVVTQGTYSDYGIIAATLDRDVAEAIAKKYYSKWDPPEIEEYEDAELLLKPRWNVRFPKNGPVEVEEQPFSDYYAGPRCIVYARLGTLVLEVNDVAADDKESAIKIAAEKRAAYLAEKNGLA